MREGASECGGWVVVTVAMLNDEVVSAPANSFDNVM